MDENLIDKESQVKINFLKTQAERAFYLDEFKENVSMALTEEQLSSGVIYPEILQEMKKPEVAYIKMKREIDFKYLKPYIMEAEKIDVRYTLVDSLNLLGDIGLVVVMKEAFDNNDREIVVKNIEDRFKEVGLYPEYTKYFGRKICDRHYSLVKEKLPGYEEKFKKLTMFNQLFGESCPICRIEKEKNRKW